jgi:hypothetical protein
MSKLKPIGSEKLQGSQKLNRMLEIAMYKEVNKSTLNENSTNEYNISLPDGYQYSIVKEKSGYIIKKGLNESTLDYIEPMRNRTYYRSYSQAFKKLNLITKELNELYDNPNGVSLFGEQKKYTLKTPTPPPPPAPVDEPAPAPPPVPQPELPPSPLDGGGAPPMDDSGMPPSDDMGDMPPMDDMGDMPPMDDEMGDDMMDKGDKGEEKVTFKTIQKLTGRLTQKVRALENEDGLTSEEIKYVVNMVLSSLNLDILEEDDKDDIIAKIDGSDEEGGEESMGDEGMPPMDDMEGMGEPPMDDTGMPPADDMGEPMPEMTEDYDNEGYQYGGRFNESKIDRIISNYFEKSPNEPKTDKRLIENFKKVRNLSKSMLQLETSKSFLKNNKNYNVIGITNLDNIILESKNNKVKIDKRGNII